MDEVTVIFFSCRRLDLLYRAVGAFIKFNTYPISEYIIVNDSGDKTIHEQLRNTYEGVTFVFNEKNVGLIKSLDLGYSHIKTEYFFMCEDDWMVTKGGFIEPSLTIMKTIPNIEHVWVKIMNAHPVEPEICEVNGVKYQYVAVNHRKGEDGPFGWHGFSTSIGLKRMSDYRKVAPYADISWEGTIWMREQAIGQKYFELGYRQVVLLDDYAENIGYGKSEYVSGLEDNE